MKRVCKECGGKRWSIRHRDDGRYAVERCDSCSWFGSDDPRTISDEDAARLARETGVECDDTYPCIVHDQTQYRSGAK